MTFGFDGGTDDRVNNCCHVFLGVVLGCGSEKTCRSAVQHCYSISSTKYVDKIHLNLSVLKTHKCLRLHFSLMKFLTYQKEKTYTYRISNNGLQSTCMG